MTSDAQLAEELEALRRDLEGINRERPGTELYLALLRMLESGILHPSWDEQDGKTVRIWTANGDTTLLDFVDTIDNRLHVSILELVLMQQVKFAVGEESGVKDVHFRIAGRAVI